MRKLIYILIGICFFSSCKKENPTHIFGVTDVVVTQSSVDKNRLKTDVEFVSIAYADIFGASISQGELENVSVTYKSFGDKSLVIEMIIRKFIMNEGNNIPIIDRSSTSTTEVFVKDIYKKIYNREPSAFEKWYLSDLIKNESSITSEMVYYSLMTATEYRYY